MGLRFELSVQISYYYKGIKHVDYTDRNYSQQQLLFVMWLDHIGHNHMGHRISATGSNYISRRHTQCTHEGFVVCRMWNFFSWNFNSTLYDKRCITFLLTNYDLRPLVFLCNVIQ